MSVLCLTIRKPTIDCGCIVAFQGVIQSFLRESRMEVGEYTK